MDPDTVYTTMRDEHADLTERVEAAIALRGWLAAGGFPPADLTRAAAFTATDRFLARVELCDADADEYRLTLDEV